MRVVVHDAFGPPDKVLRVEPRALPSARAHEVVVALEASPIHPADLLAIQGRAASRPRLPGAIPGREAIGRIASTGEAIEGLSDGDRVLVSVHAGAWQDRIVVNASSVTRVEEGTDPAQLCMARINPSTACLLLRALVDLRPGEWLIQNAANGAVGQLVAARARQLGIHTINLVRRRTAETVVRRAGGDVVLLDTGRPLNDAIRSYTGGAGIRLALDAVGGRATGTLVESLTHGGTLVSYGAVSGQQVAVDHTILAARDLRIRAFWLPAWMRTATPEARAALQDEALQLVLSGAVDIPIASTWGLGAIGGALHAVAAAGRNGKVLLTGEAWAAG